MAVSASIRSRTLNRNPFFKATVTFENTAAEATSATEDVELPVYFRPNRPINAVLECNETWDGNAVLLPIVYAYDKATNRITASLRFHNGNAAGGAAINPGAKNFLFYQV